VPHEKPVVKKEIARGDGRCFVQATVTGTKFQYKIELRAERLTHRVIAALVDVSTNERLADTPVKYVAGEKATVTEQGSDCDGMQASLYKHWEVTRASLSLPSACALPRKM